MDTVMENIINRFRAQGFAIVVFDAEELKDNNIDPLDVEHAMFMAGERLLEDRVIIQRGEELEDV